MTKRNNQPGIRIACKRKHDQRKKTEAVESLNPASRAAAKMEIDEYYWGYGSGVFATKAAEWGEFVPAELTQSFDQADVSYFKPLMHPHPSSETGAFPGMASEC